MRNMKIHESAEDYLEAILIVKERTGLVRSIDIAHEKNLSKPSVSIAMKRLRENGYIQMSRDGLIALTPAGLEIDQQIYTRHRLLSQFLEHLGVSPENAAADACKMEHDISAESFEKLIVFAKAHRLLDETEENA